MLGKTTKVVRSKSSTRLAALVAVSVLLVACGSDGSTANDSNGGETTNGNTESTDANTESTDANTENTDANTDSSAGGDSTSAETPAEGDPVQGGTLRVAHPTAPTTLDPAAGNSGYDHIYLYPMFDTLVNFVPETLEALPGLASSWEFTDETTLVLNLNEGVSFHDGTAFNAEAVKANLERSKTWEKSNIAGDLINVDTVDVVDEYTVQINLTQPDTALPLILSDRAGMMVSPTAFNTDPDGFGQNPVGTGPFQFDEWLTGESVTVKRNDNYWGDPAHLDSIVFSIIIDRDTAINAVLSGQQDFTFNVDPTQLARVENEDGIVNNQSAGLFHYEFYTNNGRPPFDDVRVRQAMNYAIDRDSYLQATQFGTGEVAWHPIPSAHWAFPADQVPTYGYTPEKARELLSEAGYADGLTIEVVGWTADPDVRRAEVLQQQLADVGVTMNITATEVPQATAAFFNDKNYDAYLAAWTGRPDPSLTYSLLFGMGGYFNAAAYEAPGLEAALQKTRAVSDQGERTEAFGEASRIIADEALYVPLAYPPDFAVYRDTVQGYVPNLLAKPKFAYI